MNTTGRYLTFSLGPAFYAVPLAQVREVIAAVEVTPLPNVPAHVRGIINLRGDVVTIVDLNAKFKTKPTPSNPKSAFVILDLAGANLGVVVDAVNSVVGFAAADVQPPPDVRTMMPPECLTGVVNREGKLTLLLDLTAAFGPADVRAAA